MPQSVSEFKWLTHQLSGSVLHMLTRCIEFDVSISTESWFSECDHRFPDTWLSLCERTSICIPSTSISLFCLLEFWFVNVLVFGGELSTLVFHCSA